MAPLYKSIIVAVDGSQEAEYAFRKSLEIAYRNQGAQLNIVNIIDSRYLGPLDKDIGEQVTKEIAKSVNADLIICGATGHPPIERFLIGSVSEAIVRTAKFDVLVVRTPAD